MPQPLMKPPEIMEYLGVSRRTFQKLVNEPDTPIFKIGGSWRANSEDLEAWVKSRREIQKTPAPSVRGRKPKVAQNNEF